MKRSILFTLSLFSLAILAGCSSVSRAPKSIKVDGTDYLACSGLITVSADGENKHTVSFTGPDHESQEIHGASTVEISSLPLTGNDLREQCDSKFREQEEERRRKEAEAATREANARRWQELKRIEKNVCGDKSILLYNNGSDDITAAGTITCGAEGYNGPITGTDYVSLEGCSALQKEYSQYSCHLAPVVQTFTDIRPIKRRSAAVRHLKATANTALTTTELGSLKCGEVQAGDIVTLLEQGSFGVKVRTANGASGWAYAGWFEVVH